MSTQAELQHIEGLLDYLDKLRDATTGARQTLAELVVESSKTSQIVPPTNSEGSANSNSTTSSRCSDGNPLEQPVRSSRKRGCPSMRLPTPLPACRNLSCNSSDVVEDAGAGSVVCIQCGLIQSSYVFENADTVAVYHGGASRIVVHRYSRIAILRAILLSLQGETRLVLSPEEQSKITTHFLKEGPPESAITIKRSIRVLGLSPRLTHHATTMWFQLYGGLPAQPPSEYEIREVLRLFHALENVWDRLPLASFVRNGRKKFLSLPLAWKVLCEDLGYHNLGSIMDELQIKNKKNRDAQTHTLSILLQMSRK